MIHLIETILLSTHNICLGLEIRKKNSIMHSYLETCAKQEHHVQGRVRPLVTCLATDACLTADPGVMNSIPARSYTFVEIDHEIISMVTLLASLESFKKGCCQLQAKVCARSTG